MADDPLVVSALALSLSNEAILNALIQHLRHKGLISGAEHVELFDSALLTLEQISGVAQGNPAIAIARARVEVFLKSARTQLR